MKQVLSILALALCLLPLSAEVTFSDLDLSMGGVLLFRASAELPGGEAYSTLFRAKVPDGPIEQLTFYPENIQFVDEGRALQLQNRFGLFRTDDSLSSLAPVKGFPAFVNGSQVQTGKLILTQASPDGRYVLSITPLESAYGRLAIHDTQNGTETVVSAKLGYLPEAFPALWSPDSSFFVYSSANRLFYYSTEQLRGKRVPDEKFRDLGPGAIACARWSPSGQLYTIQGRQLFRSDPREFFTRTLYSSLLQTGTIVGEVPFAFDANFDRFEISPSGKSVLLIKQGRSVFLYQVKNDDRSAEDPAMMPYLSMPGNALVDRVVWPSGGPITILASILVSGERRARAFRVADPEFAAAPAPAAQGPASGLRSLGYLRQSAQVQDLDGMRDIALSPNGEYFAVAGPDSLSILNYGDFSLKKKFDADRPLKVIWRNNDELVLAGASRIELVRLSSDSRGLIGLSQADASGWSASSAGILAKAGGKAYALKAPSGWDAVDAFDPAPASSASDDYRVYSDQIAAGAYRNTVMVRSIKSLKTASLVIPPAKRYQGFPLKDEERVPDVFDHGSRLRRREVAFAFDLYDGDEGLMYALDTLKDYGIKSTFFLNGEFIRRYPGAVKDLASSGMEIGSMFFSDWDMTDGRFTIDRDFVQRGLARNEDDYFAVSGKELSAIWHAPYYAVNSEIVAAAKGLNYAYVGRDVDPLDWVTARERYRFPGMYLDSAAIVERIMAQKKPGSIIAVRLGIPQGERDDYLFHRLDILINALIAEGYEIVPVSVLMDHAK